MDREWKDGERQNQAEAMVSVPEPDEVTAAAIVEGRRLASDCSAEGYRRMEDLRAALEG